MNELAVELIGGICQNLTLLDELSLLQSCKSLSNLTQDSSKKRFLEILSRKLSSLQTAKDILSVLNKRCVLSGSIVVQTLLGKYWKESDIDIYVERPNLYGLFEILERNGFTRRGWSSQNYPGMYSTSLQFEVFKFHKTGSCPIDVIACDRVDNAVRKFDFQLVRNKYDGQTVYRAGSSLKTRTCVIPSDRIHAGRIIKYTRRGFDIRIECRELIEQARKNKIYPEGQDHTLSHTDYEKLSAALLRQERTLQNNVFAPIRAMSKFIRNHPERGLRRRFAALCGEVDRFYEKSFLEQYLDTSLSRSLRPVEIFTGKSEGDSDGEHIDDEDSGDEAAIPLNLISI